MSPLFGRGDDDPGSQAPDADVAAMTAEIQRVAALPLAGLAVEVMTRGFGPGGPGGPGKPGTLEQPVVEMTTDLATGFTIATAFTDAWRGRHVGRDLTEQLTALVEEGLQVLEHAALVRMRYTNGAPAQYYVATRTGRAAIERGDVAQRIGSTA